MPARGESSAPSYNRSKPRELIRFFRELERLFVRASVTSEKEKKEQALRYVDFDIEEFWQTLPEFKSSLATYSDFKAAIFSMYPEASGNYLYSLSDLDLLLKERQQVGINNVTDLADFHLRFHMITSWLIDREHICHLEQKRAYVRAFQPRLMTLIANRLQTKFPNLHPNLPYPICDVYEAAQFVLHKSARRYFVSVSAPPATTPSISATTDSHSNSESLQTIFAELTKTFTEALGQDSRRMDHPSFNQSNRIPNWSSAAGLRHATDMAPFYANRLSPDERIAQIEAELSALRASKSKFTPAVHNRAEEAESAYVYEPDNEDTSPEKLPKKEIAPMVIAQQQETKRVFNKDPATPIISARRPTILDHVHPEPEHLFPEAKDILFAPSLDRKIGKANPQIGNKSGTAYRTQLSAYNVPMYTDTYLRSKATPNATTQQQFLFLAPDVRTQAQDVTSTATCKESFRTTHSLRNICQLDNSEATDLSTSLIIEAPIYLSSTLASDLPATSATSVSVSNEQLSYGKSLSPSATSLEFSIPLRNALGTSISDPCATSDHTCHPTNSISDPAFAIIPATLSFNSDYDDLPTISKRYSAHGNHCGPITSTLDTANTISTSTISNHCDICDSDLKFAISLSTLDIPFIISRVEHLRFLRVIRNPFRNIPTLDPELMPYVPNGCFKQDRKAIFKVFIIPSLPSPFLHILGKFFTFHWLHQRPSHFLRKARHWRPYITLRSSTLSGVLRAMYRLHLIASHLRQAIIIVHIAISLVLRQPVAQLVIMGGRISHSRSHFGNIGRISPLKSDSLAISQYVLRFFCDLAKSLFGCYPDTELRHHADHLHHLVLDQSLGYYIKVPSFNSPSPSAILI